MYSTTLFAYLHYGSWINLLVLKSAPNKAVERGEVPFKALLILWMIKTSHQLFLIYSGFINIVLPLQVNLITIVRIRIAIFNVLLIINPCLFNSNIKVIFKSICHSVYITSRQLIFYLGFKISYHSYIRRTIIILIR